MNAYVCVELGCRRMCQKKTILVLSFHKNFYLDFGIRISIILFIDQFWKENIQNLIKKRMFYILQHTHRRIAEKSIFDVSSIEWGECNR